MAGVPAVALSDPKRRTRVVRGARRFGRRLRPSTGPWPAEAVLEIASKPDGASIALDDEEQGRTPLALPRPTGRHRIVVRRSGYVDPAVHVELAVNGRARVEAEL